MINALYREHGADFLGQLKMMKKLTSGAGGMMGLLSLLPGVGGKIKEMKSQVDDKKLNHIEALILSMTPKERKRPEIINGGRRKRIANGSGNTVNDLNQFLKQFQQMRAMMKAMNQDAGGLAKVILEINPRHPLIRKLAHRDKTGDELAPMIAEQIRDNALIGAGLLDTPTAMLARMEKVLTAAL